MKATVAATACLCLTACSADSGSSEPSLRGKWLLEGDPCSVALVFWGANDGDLSNKYEGDIICFLQDGSLGVEAERGMYSASDTQIDFVPEFASCFLDDRDYSPYTLAYNLESDRLRVIDSTGGLVLGRWSSDPNDTGDGTGVVSFGCAEEDSFVDGELMEIP